jgi:predicted transcriptional regulator of viral defense system
MNAEKFAEKLISSEILFKKDFFLEGLKSNKERFLTPEASVFQVAVSLINKSYLSHYSAVYLNGLTTQIPKTIYISFEQSKKQNINRTLEQAAIDSAFTKPQRKSANVTTFDEYTFLIHNGMYSNRSGVFSLADIPITNIERTLIDIAVRPDYAGGVDSVLDAYRRALDKISINKLVAILDRFDFIYPYHQTIGFYLEKAGLDDDKLRVLRGREMRFDFYLTYEMIEKDYDKGWRLYYPKGM